MKLDTQALAYAREARQKALEECEAVMCQSDHDEAFLLAYLSRVPANRRTPMKLDTQAVEAAAKAMFEGRPAYMGTAPDSERWKWEKIDEASKEYHRESARLSVSAYLSRVPAPEPAAAPDVAELVRALKPLVDAADGLSKGYDWNSGTHAALHGYRQKLLDALPAARDALAKYRENGNG